MNENNKGDSLNRHCLNNCFSYEFSWVIHYRIKLSSLRLVFVPCDSPKSLPEPTPRFFKIISAEHTDNTQ